MQRIHSSAFSFLAALTVAASVEAQWSTNPATNLAIADRPADQVLPKIASTTDGGSYIAWFDHASGNFDVYLQRLDAQGNELWPHNGILVSNNTQSTSLVDWDIMADANDHAVVTFTDARAGSDLDVYAYRVSPTGAMVWGANGVTLSNNTDYEPDPRLAQTTDGSFVFVWARIPGSGTGSIRIQKLDAVGNPQYPADGLPINGGTNERPAFCSVVAADNGSYIVSWIREFSISSPLRHLRAQKFDANGNPLWGPNPLVIYDTVSLPPAYKPILQRDGSGGALMCWHSATGVLFNSYVQHVSSAGLELFPHEGVPVSTEANRNKLDPSLAYIASTGELIVAFTKKDSNQVLSGTSAQKVSPAGLVQWGANGIDLLPLDNVTKFSTRSVPFSTGAMIFLFDAPNPPSQLEQLVGMRIDNAGAFVWPLSTRVLSSTLANKDKLVATIDSTGVAKLAWHDDRVLGDPDNVYAQNINPDGTLGFQNNCATSSFCVAAPNSTGFGSTISSVGTTSVSANTFTLTASGSPPHVNGFFFYGSTATSIPLGDGFRCVAGAIFRLGPAVATDGTGSVSRFVDMTTPPAGSGPGQITAGATKYFQWYYRNVGGPGGTNCNLSNGLRADFCP